MSKEQKPTDADLIREVRVLRLQPGDVVVYRTDSVLNMAMAADIREQMRRIWPDNECVAVSGGEFEVMRSEGGVS